MDNNEKVAYTDDFLTQDEMDSVVSSFANGDPVDSDIVDKMDVSQIELALMEAGFTGATSDDLDNGVAYYSQTKEDMVALFRDDIVNELYFDYGMDDSVLYTILYKDGTKKHLSHDDSSDFDNVHFTSGFGKRTYEIARKALDIRNVAAIIRSDGYGQPRYYLSQSRSIDAKYMMQQYGFEFWENGRGEKQRDYIQDDWL